MVYKKVRKMQFLIEDFLDVIEEEVPMDEYEELDNLYAEAEDLLREIQ